MPDYSRYPRPASVKYFEDSLSWHDHVDGFSKISDYYYKVDRVGMSTIEILITNYYTLGYDELLQILNEYPDVDCVVTISNWNKCTEQAYQEGKLRGVGVFESSEYLGAINCERPYQYVRPIDREDNEGNRHFWD